MGTVTSRPVQSTERCSTIRTLCRSLSNCGSRLQERVRNFDRVGFQQSCARGFVSLMGKTTTAFLSTGVKKFVEISLQRRASTDFANAVTIQHAVGAAATAQATCVTVAVGAVDSIFANVCSEQEGKETWKGMVKRNGPGFLH